MHSTRQLGHTLRLWPEGVGGHSGVETRQAAQVAAAAAAAVGAGTHASRPRGGGSRGGGGDDVKGVDANGGGGGGGGPDADAEVELRHAVALMEGVAARPLPPPLAADNWESGNATCFLGHELRVRGVGVWDVKMGRCVLGTS